MSRSATGTATHARCGCGAHAIGRIFEHDARLWRCIETGGGAQKQIGGGFDAQPVAAGAHTCKDGAQRMLFKPALDPLARRARCHCQANATRMRCGYQPTHAGLKRLLLAQRQVALTVFTMERLAVERRAGQRLEFAIGVIAAGGSQPVHPALRTQIRAKTTILFAQYQKIRRLGVENQ